MSWHDQTALEIARKYIPDSAGPQLRAQLQVDIIDAMRRAYPATQRCLPLPGSPEASAMLDSLLAEYNYPSNTKNAARAGWEAAQRWLATQPPSASPVAVPEDDSYRRNGVALVRLSDVDACQTKQGRAADGALSGKQQVIDALYAAWMREPVGETVGAIGNAIQYLQSEASQPPSTSPVAVPENIMAVVKAAQEWSAERAVKDWSEADLMKAIATMDGDWPGCEECDHECDEPCRPATVAEMHRSIDNQIAQLVHDGKLPMYEGYAPPDGFKPYLPRRRVIPIAAQPALPDAGLDSQRLKFLVEKADWHRKGTDGHWTIRLYNKRHTTFLQTVDAAIATSKATS